MSSDGHRWLTNTYTTEFEETHWPASYGGKRNDAGDDPEVIANWPGRIGFTDANASPEPNDYNEHGGIYAAPGRATARASSTSATASSSPLLDEDGATEPTGVREHANVPMEKVVRDSTDHLFPSFNTHIPDAPLPENPIAFNRFGRFKQVFDANYVDRARGVCKLPSYVDLYYPNDHGGGANDINPGGADWDFKRFVQDNDAALGLTVELISKSPCWKDTVIFVVEDDTQNGLDHVDGYRSIFLADQAVGEAGERHARPTSAWRAIFKTVDLDPGDAAAEPVRRGGDRLARHLHGATRLLALRLRAADLRRQGEEELEEADPRDRLLIARRRRGPPAPRHPALGGPAAPGAGDAPDGPPPRARGDRAPLTAPLPNPLPHCRFAGRGNPRCLRVEEAFAHHEGGDRLDAFALADAGEDEGALAAHACGRRGPSPPATRRRAGARSVLLITSRSDRVMPGPPLRGILSPPATSMT